MTQSYFVIGTDTNVGKTYVASRLVQYFAQSGLKAIGMKPIASGCEVGAQGELQNEDVIALSNASNVVAAKKLINPYQFAPAIAPHIAAEQAAVVISLDAIVNAYQQLTTLAEVVIVEGAGGFFVPLNQTQTLADLAVQINIPIILVVGIRLGCINHALLTVEAINARGLTLAGWVANEIDPNSCMFAENLTSLQQRIAAPCLSVVRWQGEATFNLTSVYQQIKGACL
ncbi:MAG: dethiobiotin synthase [Methylotenera sp.]|nr:dethiobiotin synthase [Methylotenera sp.]MDP2280409.1 dethiobiotin synthase [Methylotenera sp.]MDP2402668.1 dethiobiotin synthase [Methylotenera sp.]MDP3060468.1 dethiobiotin synthase [Methylotenera sp.]MDP3094313.1 dethiobiotin synthase [Methylotenera sp.]